MTKATANQKAKNLNKYPAIGIYEHILSQYENLEIRTARLVEEAIRTGKATPEMVLALDANGIYI